MKTAPTIVNALLSLLLVTCATVAMSQENPASKINAQSLSRVSPIMRSDMKPADLPIYDKIAGADRTTPLLGPGGVSLHIPPVAQAMDILNQYLRYESVIGRHYIEVAILVSAREFDQQYEWAAHEPTALEEGAAQAVVDAIKFNRDTRSLPDKDRVIIDYGRQIMREHKLDQAIWDEAVALFGQQGALEIAAIIGDYLLAAVMLHAVDQQIPPERTARLPELP